jgi:hypothetical protein
LGVVSNQLVVTNVAGTFESLTGNNFVLGGSALTNINSSAVGSFVSAQISGTNSIGEFSGGARQQGFITGTAIMERYNRGSSQQGFIGGTARIGEFAYGSLQQGYISSGTSATIGEDAYGAVQIGYWRLNATATNLAKGAIQILGGQNNGEVYTTTSSAFGSILVGPGTQTNAYGILAAGPIESSVAIRGNHFGNAANLTNFPTSILTVTAGNANYWRITTAPTGSTSSGSSGQMAVEGTNLFIYSPNALGVGTARWIRVSGSATW